MVRLSETSRSCAVNQSSCELGRCVALGAFSVGFLLPTIMLLLNPSSAHRKNSFFLASAALGGHRDACQSCGYQAISYNSCRNRHCPKCQAQARERWLTARERELLDTSYFHVVFTVPHELNVLALENPRLFYDLLFAASAQTLLEIASDPKHLRAEIGVIAILHTWRQNLLLHPHIHCVIPAGGLSLDHRRWVRPRYPFFLPVKVLSRVFRASSSPA